MRSTALKLRFKSTHVDVHDDVRNDAYVDGLFSIGTYVRTHAWMCTDCTQLPLETQHKAKSSMRPKNRQRVSTFGATRAWIHC